MDRLTADAVIIGAGAIGLACGDAMATNRLKVVILEHASEIATGTSSRNSEVVHAGLYYMPKSLKSQTCIAGRTLLYHFLEKHRIPHRKCGKLILATSHDEEAKLAQILDIAQDCDVEGISQLTSAQATDLEPSINCTSALFSAETGIFDSHQYMLALKHSFEDAGGIVAVNTPAIKTEQVGENFEVYCGGRDPAIIRCRRLINAAGLQATQVAQLIQPLQTNLIPQLHLAKGNYFGCSANPGFQHLLYPAPVDGGLGVHLTLDLQNSIRFGPDVEWLGTSDPSMIDYKVNPYRANEFYGAIRKYWPGLPDGSLFPDFSGVRPKLTTKGKEPVDFIIQTKDEHGIDGLLNLYGIESPGLTASLAIGEIVASYY
jgi:L-2-hydroxyglutarate oxidase LhgO